MLEIRKDLKDLGLKTQKPESLITRENASEFHSELPSGYELAYRGKKGFTQNAKGYLRGYWGNVINAKEAKLDIAKDREQGLKRNTTTETYLNNYINSQYKGIGILVDLKMIKEIK